MKIAVLSGKGGTGKTMIAVNLAAIADHSVFLDCDVEEPNGHLFLKSDSEEVTPIFSKIPVVEPSLCSGCRTCVDFCRYNALAYVEDRLLIFTDLCHSCGGCVFLCPNNALFEDEKPIGEIRSGNSGNVRIITGFLNPGVESGVPIIRELLKSPLLDQDRTVFLDCPPGSSCSVMESIKPADYCLVVAEATVFGAHDLQMVHELLTALQKPFGVVLNKCMEGDNPSEIYCQEHGISIIDKIPFDRELGKASANGVIVARENHQYRQMFSDMLNRIIRRVKE